MQRYLELDQRLNLTKKKKENLPPMLDQYHRYLMREFQSNFSIHFFHAILSELEQLNQYKIKEISKQLEENEKLLAKLFCDEPSDEECQDDGIIHLSSTPAQPIYLPYRPVHMVYLRTKVLINGPTLKEGVTHAFIADLTHTKRTSILDPSTNFTQEIPTKSIYFAQACSANTLLTLKLRVMIGSTRRCGIIGEEPAKSNQYRCLIFYLDEEKNLQASYHSPSDLHLSFDQNVPLNEFDPETKFFLDYFKSYPERMMLRVKEGTMIKVRHGKISSHPAIVLQLDCSMILIEFCQSHEHRWIYRGSTCIEQMKNYYNIQHEGGRHSARQHLSARKSNAPEIICLNDQMKTKLNRSIESDENRERDLFFIDRDVRSSSSS